MANGHLFCIIVDRPLAFNGTQFNQGTEGVSIDPGNEVYKSQLLRSDQALFEHYPNAQ